MKIPRIDKGNRPSGVPSGALMGASPVGAPLAALSNLAEVGYKIAADSEQEEALKLRAATEAKQAIVNEVTASRRAGDFEESLVATTAKLQKDFWENPDKAPEQLLAAGRQMADQQIKDAPNSAVQLDMAQKTASRLDSAMRGMHNWAQARQTQKAKGDLSIVINRAAAGAESQPTLYALGNYIKTKEAELSSVFQNVLGAEAQGKMAEMRTGMAQAWLHVYGDQNPIGGLTALKAENGPLVDHLNAAQRESARKEMVSSFEGLTKTREMEAITKGIGSNSEIADAFMRGDPQFAGIAFSQLRSLGEQKKVVEAQMKFDQVALENLGIDLQGYSPSDVPELIDERIEFVQALEKARRRQTSFDAPDNPASVDALMLTMDKALKSKNGRDMAAIVTQQKNVAIALSAEKISGATATRMFKTMSLAMQTAAENQEGLWGPNFVRAFRAPREAGIAELNNQLGGLVFRGQFSNLSAEIKTAIRLNYEGQFSEAKSEGKSVNALGARKMALRAIALETGQPIPGVD